MKSIELNKASYLLPVLLSLILPAISFAQTGTVRTVEGNILGIIQAGVNILFALAFLFFLWQLVRYLMGAEEEKSERVKKIVTALVILVIMFSVWGILRFIQGSIGSDRTQSPIQQPNLPTRR
ncbi:MAG: hypothetical protein OXU73_01845 [Candidatus Campbellbacteria bacterium]|nr:hypothetical protein [Candidatus Campbellbacteria bacterium]